jgi:hypothetical protein
MREKALYNKVDRGVARIVHRQSMTGASRGMNGTLDRYYDGPNGDLWIEYKQLDHMPKDGIVRPAPRSCAKSQPKGCLSAMQMRWFARRCRNGGNAWVVVGLPDGRALRFATILEVEQGRPASAAVSVDIISDQINEHCVGEE